MTTRTMTAARTDAAGDASSARLFARTCAAEWTRLWTVQATWWLLVAVAVIMAGIGTIAGLDAAADQVPPTGEPAWVPAPFALLPAQFALLALSIMAVTSDYATGGIVPALQWTPRRSVLFVARTMVTVLTATCIGVLGALACTLVAYTLAHPILALPLDEGLDVLGTVALVVATECALAIGLGFLLRSTAGALVSMFLMMLVLPLLLRGFGYEWLTTIAEILPGSGAIYLLNRELPGMTITSSVVVLLCWAGGALLLGWLRLLRDDANR